ncbi:MAG TPA: Mut7-C RNAse domain-containing protein [Chthoniobacterales bacterium]
MEPFRVRLRFHGDLNYFLKTDVRDRDVRRELKEPTSVKDVIESCGVPHTEVDRILIDSAAVNFSHVLRRNIDIEVYPVDLSDTTAVGSGLQPRHADRFVGDGHLGKLARNLRLLGFDVAYDPELDDRQLLHIMQSDKRALLTRDRRLLMHSVVIDGYCPRSSDPLEQTGEVIRRFHLAGQLRPFTRCLQCNAPLKAVDKEKILDQLEPLTRIYYNEFRCCTGCGKIFWRGSHFKKLEALLDRFRSNLKTEPRDDSAK